jgi:hypothetical protein
MVIIQARVAISVYLEARKNIGKGFDDGWLMVASMYQFLVQMTYINNGQATDLFCSLPGYGK